MGNPAPGSVVTAIPCSAVWDRPATGRPGARADHTCYYREVLVVLATLEHVVFVVGPRFVGWIVSSSIRSDNAWI